jgi:hypothetical protein
VIIAVGGLIALWVGARAMYLGSTVYRIHGTNAPETIGQACVSSGCFRLVNDDVIDLYSRVNAGTKVTYGKISSFRPAAKQQRPSRANEITLV